MKISVKESCIIRPAHETPKQPLWLSNLDLINARLHLGVVHFYEPNGATNFFDTRVLKQSLSRVLVPFYPVAGRLGRDPNGRLEIRCNGEGVLFVEADADVEIGRLGEFVQNSELGLFVPKVDYSTDISSYPLLLVQVTKFKCGAICIGLGWHLYLSDGTGFMRFIQSWVKISRGLPPSITPFIDRTVLRVRFPSYPTFHHTEFDPHPTINTLVPIRKFQSSPNTILTLKITHDQLNILKTRVSSIKHYTTHEILVALIWRCACKARGLSDDQATRLHVTLNGRFRLFPSLPHDYFGCAIFPVRLTALSGELQAESLKRTVERIREAVKKMNDSYLRSALHYLDQHQDINTLVPKQGNELYRCPNLSIVSWNKFPVSDADFGWGPPTYIGPTNIYSEGKGFITANPINDQSLFLVMCLMTNHACLFEKLFYRELLLESAM